MADGIAASDEQLLRLNKIGTDGPSLVEFLRRSSLSDEQLIHVQRLVRQLGNGTFKAREQATAALEFAGDALSELARTH